MELRFWWLALLCLVGLILLAIVQGRHAKHKRTTDRRKPLANNYRLLRLTEYQHVISQHTRQTRIALVAILITILAVLGLIGRPTATKIVEPEMRNRDIVLCLDISGSMLKADAAILKQYQEATAKMRGERIGLVIFNGAPKTIFPLTDDYDFITEQLSRVHNLISNRTYEDTLLGDSDDYYDLLAGTSSSGGSSLIGDGLGGCVNRFDAVSDKRARSIIFATDNELGGNPIISLPEAAAVAKNRNIRVYGIHPEKESAFAHSLSRKSQELSTEFRHSMLSTGGDYYRLSDSNIADAIVQKITSQEATRFRGSPQLVHTDTPLPLMVVLVVGLSAALLLLWRIGL